jgi:hypothetical protein
MTPEEKIHKVDELNHLIEAGQDKYGEKLNLVNPDIISAEAGTIKELLQKSETLLNSSEVGKAWIGKRVSISNLEKHLSNSLKWMDAFTAYAHQYKKMCLDKQSVTEVRQHEHFLLVRWEQYYVRINMALENTIKAIENGRSKEATILKLPKQEQVKGLSKVAATLLFGMLGGVTGLVGVAEPLYGQENKPPAEQQAEVEQKVEEEKALTEEDITKLMAYDTVKEILDEKDIISGSSITHVVYDAESNATNYDSLVFQNHLKAEERKPVMVLFYNDKGGDFSERSAIVFKKLSKHYDGKINFVAYNISENKSQNENEIAKANNLNDLPSIGMYLKWDILQSETVENNAGAIKQVDVMNKGPSKSSHIEILFSNCRDYWVPTNIFLTQSVKNNNKVYRHNNKGVTVKAVGDSDLLSKRE